MSIRVEENKSAIIQILKSQEMQQGLKTLCENKASELDGRSSLIIHDKRGVSGGLFGVKVNVISSSAVGVIYSKRGKIKRVKNGKNLTTIGARIANKHGFMHW